MRPYKNILAFAGVLAIVAVVVTNFNYPTSKAACLSTGDKEIDKIDRICQSAVSKFDSYHEGRDYFITVGDIVAAQMDEDTTEEERRVLDEILPLFNDIARHTTWVGGMALPMSEVPAMSRGDVLTYPVRLLDRKESVTQQ